MTTEAHRRSQLIKLLEPLHAKVVENSIDEGTPDLNCTAGWIEMKNLSAWPVRSSTIVRPPHFTDGQRLWLRQRCAAGGRAWMMLTVGEDWCLIWGQLAAEFVGIEWTQRDFLLAAPGRLTWASLPTTRDLVKALVVRSWP